jgi:hypothetical protein
MNFPVNYMSRLAPRGGAGLACDDAGVALGAADLARMHFDDGGRRRRQVRPPRTARWLEAGDLCHAGVEAVMLRFSELTADAVAKLRDRRSRHARRALGDEPRAAVVDLIAAPRADA